MVVAQVNVLTAENKRIIVRVEYCCIEQPAHLYFVAFSRVPVKRRKGLGLIGCPPKNSKIVALT